MHMNKLFRPSVGADLSALGGCSSIRIILFKCFMALTGIYGIRFIQLMVIIEGHSLGLQ